MVDTLISSFGSLTMDHHPDVEETILAGWYAKTSMEAVEHSRRAVAEAMNEGQSFEKIDMLIIQHTHNMNQSQNAQNDYERLRQKLIYDGRMTVETMQAIQKGIALF